MDSWRFVWKMVCFVTVFFGGLALAAFLAACFFHKVIGDNGRAVFLLVAALNFFAAFLVSGLLLFSVDRGLVRENALAVAECRSV